MDSSDSSSESTLSCSSSSCDSKAYSEDTDEEMDKGTDFNVLPYHYKPSMEYDRHKEYEEGCKLEEDNDELLNHILTHALYLWDFKLAYQGNAFLVSLKLDSVHKDFCSYLSMLAFV